MKSKFWGYRDVGGRGGSPQFVMLANANGSSSCRLFDARSGASISYNTSRGGTYAAAYGSIYQDCRELFHLPASKQMNLSYVCRAIIWFFFKIRSESKIVGSLSGYSGGAPGMLAGTWELINEALGLDVAFDTKTAAQRLSVSPISLDSNTLLTRMYECVVGNWDRSECRSTQLWRSSAKTEISAHNTSPEKTLEKAIAEWARDWFNQIPAAAGLLSHVEERHMNVDLGHFVAPGHVELIELKAGPHADTPLKAAFEIVGYGLLYCFARAHRVQLALPRVNRVLDAKRVDLKVLAPREVYAGYRLKWLEESLDAGLKQFSKRRFTGSLEMNFRFESFPDGFQWPGTKAYEIPKILDRRADVGWR